VPPHVLIVEDSALVTSALRLLLEETGHRVSDAADVAAAVRLAVTERPDLILLDLTLRSPAGMEESGLEVLDRLHAELGRVPMTVAVTGDDAPGVRERCLQAGCRDVLIKPISPLELPRRIQQWLSENGGEAVRPSDPVS
jgi:CheY-like chemotaxis protein